ncbi:MAG: tRNA preQ1(34) S-adenosylmethionine ribosyltransferase-isomerase QueA [Alphaproteobacteria bacterium]|nr:tRNA preQ1(34) S-adenosylmethionine ribosyltransferase-isomerase QueA [Alphaproteobacteria bacterium]
MSTDDTDLDAWDFPLPDAHIARYPADRRDASRLLVARRSGGVEHRVFADLPGLLEPGDALVVNDTRVMAARLHGHRKTGGRIEILVLQPGSGPVPCMIRNARRLSPGEVVEVGGEPATIVERLPDGLFAVDFGDAAARMEAHGELPLPPYLGRGADDSDRERYQTIFAGPLGAAAAPTAGLHFTPEVLEALAARGIGVHPVTLHVGIGTFRPLRPEDVERGALHPEPWTVPEATATALAEVRARGGRIVAVGTTSTRTLEAATPEGARSPRAGSGTTTLFLRPGSALRTVDALVTNFHLPRSSLLMLVATLLGRERLLETYGLAIREGYRFYSYGDAMLVL